MKDYIDAANKVIEEADNHNWIKCQGFLAHCAHRDSIAAALREAAASAYDDAATMISVQGESK